MNKIYTWLGGRISLDVECGQQSFSFTSKQVSEAPVHVASRESAGHNKNAVILHHISTRRADSSSQDDANTNFPSEIISFSEDHADTGLGETEQYEEKGTWPRWKRTGRLE